MSYGHSHSAWAGMIAPLPLLWSITHTQHPTMMGLLTGLCEASVLLGMLHVGLLPTLWLALAWALCRGLAVALSDVLSQGNRVLMLWFLLPSWIVCEWLHASFPWGLPAIFGATQDSGPWLSFARWGGAYLVSAVLLVLWIPLFDRRRIWIWPVLTTCVLTIPAVPQEHNKITIAIVQGNAHVEHNVDLVVWPEGAAPESIHNASAILAGTRRQEARDIVYNSAMLIADDEIYFADKERLALPLEAWLTPGKYTGPLPWVHGTIGTVMCLESTVPFYARRLTQDGAQFIVVMADGSRFKTSRIAKAHAKMSVMRAVETGRDVIHAGKHGSSHIAHADGSHTPMLPLYQASVLTGSVTLRQSQTPYVRFGNWPVVLSWCILTIVLVQRVAVCTMRWWRRDKHLSQIPKDHASFANPKHPRSPRAFQTP